VYQRTIMPHILVIGGANLDIKAKSLEVNRLGTSNPGRITTSPGGVARNIAHNLARLGADVGLITAMAQDHQGAVVLAATRAAGVETSRIITTATATGTYLAILNPNGELVTAMSDMRAADEITPTVIASHVEAIASAKLVVADCNLSLATLEAVAAIARDKLVIEPVSVAKSAKLADLLTSGPIFMASPNLDQIESLTHTRSISKACRKLHAMGLRHIVGHAGTDGVFVSNGEDITHVPAQAAGAIVDVTGAGDAAVAGLVFGLLQGQDLVTAATLGQKLAGRVIASRHSTLE
jgi:pseudouridine kinase